jgi:hypothetical protein
MSENPIPIFGIGEKTLLMFALSPADKEIETVTNVQKGP